MPPEPTPPESLAPDTLKNYRSTLLRSAIRLADPALTDIERNHLRHLVEKLERQLGITARQVPPPGRPRKKYSLALPKYESEPRHTDGKRALTFVP